MFADSVLFTIAVPSAALAPVASEVVDAAQHTAQAYELHVCAWRDNPKDVFTDRNPAVSCERQ